MSSVAKLKDVADLAGVSITTVSRVLNRARGVEKIPPTSVARVEAAAKTLGYRGSYLARSFQTGRSGGIGVALWGTDVSAPTAPFEAQMISAMYTAVHSSGYHLVTLGPIGGESSGSVGLTFLNEQRIDALVLPCYDPPTEALRRLEACPNPIVIIGHVASSTLPCVELDFGAGIVQAVRHLAELGHRHIAWVGPEGGWASAQIRESSFFTTAAQLGLRTSAFRFDQTTVAKEPHAEMTAVWQRLVTTLGHNREITGLVCYNDVLACGAMKAAYDSNIRVPHELSIVGFDAVCGDFSTPRLTSVSHMLQEMSCAGIQLLVEMLNQPDAWSRLRGLRRTVQPKLIVRESTARAPHRT